MTNEELAVKIQQGEKKYYPELWNRVNRIMFKILYKNINKMKLPNYMTTEDLEQELYFAFLNTVQAYDSAKPYKFNTYFDFQIKHILRQSKAKNNAAVNEVSLNTPIKIKDDEIELVDTIADDTAENKMLDLELTDLQHKVRQALAELPEQERDVLTLYYLKGLTYQRIAEICDISIDIVRRIKSTALKNLRKNRILQGLNSEFVAHYRGTEYSLWEHSLQRLDIKQNIRERRRNGEYISYAEESKILYLAKQEYIKRRSDVSRIYRF